MNFMSISARFLAFSTAALMAATAQAAITVHTTDFIPDASRTGFNGFESIPIDHAPPWFGIFHTGGPGPYAEGGISVEQINGLPPPITILVTYRPAGSEGNYGWYPTGADEGYTKITLTAGGNFPDVGMLVGSGHSRPGLLVYELLKNGAVVASGSVPHSTAFHYLGFSGGGFDTILLADGPQRILYGVRSGQENALTVDSIELGSGAPPKTVAENIGGARDLINQLPPNEVSGPGQRNWMSLLLALVLKYQTSYPSMTLYILDTVIIRTDGCALRGSPDTVFNQGGTGMDFVTSCIAQAAIYPGLIEARSQLTGGGPRP